MVLHLLDSPRSNVTMSLTSNLTDPPKESVFSSVVTRDNIWIAFLAAALNDLPVLAAHVQNACLNALTEEKCQFKEPIVLILSLK